MSKEKRTAWARWRFRLNGLVLLAPAWFLYVALTPPVAPPAWPEQALGPFTAQPVPLDAKPPYVHDDVLVKDFSVKFCEGCIVRLRQAYASVGARPAASPSGHEGILHGSLFMLHGHVPFPATLTRDDQLWISVQEWNGRVHHQAWSLQSLALE